MLYIVLKFRKPISAVAGPLYHPVATIARRPSCAAMLSPQAQRKLTATARELTADMESIAPGTADWARAASLAFSFHVTAPVSERPFWWTDEALLALSARVLRILPEA